MTRTFSDQRILPALNKLQRPSSFYWNGRNHRVSSIEQVWEVDTDWWSEDDHTWRTYYAVTTTSQMLCVIAHDHTDDRWYLVRLYD